MIFRRVKRQRKEKKSKSSVASDDEVEFLMADSAAMGLVGGAVNLFNQYQSGKTLANTDWKGMIGDVMESRDADIDMLRERATTAFKDLSFQTTSNLKDLGTKATSLYDSVGENVGGFVKSGADDFTKMLGMDEIKPLEFTGPNIKPLQFQEMLDNEEEVIVLDTRNDYEVRVGTFKNAIDLNIPSFRDFPEAVSKLPEEYKKKPIVMFCTGGIRCEKASAVMLKSGFENVKQLEGGVLDYFKEIAFMF